MSLPSRDSKAMLYRTFPEDAANHELVPFVTPRRFWILVYMFAGLSGFAMFIARFILRPLYAKTIEARRVYQTAVGSHLHDFVVKLSTLITALPNRKIIVDIQKHRLYVNTETQTEQGDQSSQHELGPLKDDIGLHTALADVSAKLTAFGQKEEETSYVELTSKVKDLKHYLREFESFSYKSLNSNYSSLGATNSGSTDAVQKVKAEIRSVKGSLLNARTFQSAAAVTTKAADVPA